MQTPDAGRPLAAAACHVSGWVLILVGLLHASITAVVSFTIWGAFKEALPGAVGTEITETLAGTLWVGATANEMLATSSLVAVASAALGAALIHLSFRLRPGGGTGAGLRPD